MCKKAFTRKLVLLALRKCYFTTSVCIAYPKIPASQKKT